MKLRICCPSRCIRPFPTTISHDRLQWSAPGNPLPLPYGEQCQDGLALRQHILCTLGRLRQGFRGMDEQAFSYATGTGASHFITCGNCLPSRQASRRKHEELQSCVKQCCRKGAVSTYRQSLPHHLATPNHVRKDEDMAGACQRLATKQDERGIAVEYSPHIILSGWKAVAVAAWMLCMISCQLFPLR